MTADDDDDEGGPHQRARMLVRTIVATVIVLVAILVTCVVIVPADEAVVISQLGKPVRVITKPGLSFKWFYPLESTIPVKLSLRTSSTGALDVGTRDGFRVLVQTYTAWRVPNDPEHILKYLRTLRNQPDEAAMQVRGFVGARMQTTASNFNFSDLVNPDPAAVHLDAFEQQLRSQVSPQLLQSYGIEVAQVGVERMTLTEATLAATVNRMAAEREIAAAQATAEGAKRAAQITSDADVYA
ncbi:MAG: SPFH domain-containing protein, partial [Alphaproteobacteria bacterium]